jgi:peptidoglycan/LPS O-acetylase OafA/YrhL
MREQVIDKSGNDAAQGAASSTSKPKPGGATHRLGILDDFRGVGVMCVFLGHCLVSLPVNLQALFDRPWQFAWSALSGKVDPQTLIAFIVFFPFHLAWAALPTFFVVSGFCIQLTFCQTSRQPSRTDLVAYYIRRIFRIYPPYLVGLLFFAFVFPWSRLPFDKLTYWGQFVTHLFMCHNVSELSVCAINSSYWTLAIEVQLYMLFPLLFFYVRRTSWTRALVWLAGIELALRIMASFGFELQGQFTSVYLRANPFYYCFSWVVGAALADAYMSGKPLPFSKVHWMVWAVIGLLTSQYPTHSFSWPFFALATGSYLSRHLSRESVEEKKSLLGRYVRATGLYSYSIYLIHTPILLTVVKLCEDHVPGMDRNPYLIFGVGAATWIFFFPLGALMYHWVEKPGIDLGKKVMRWYRDRRSQVALLNQGATP